MSSRQKPEPKKSKQKQQKVNTPKPKKPKSKRQKLNAAIAKLAKTPSFNPKILLHPQIPEPMHGLAPRVILGAKWWNATRKAAYRDNDFHCAACGVFKLQARFRQWLEGHELYEVDYLLGRLYYLRTVPLCHCCHNYIHNGRLLWLLDTDEITHAKYTAIIQHGDDVLRSVGLKRLKPYSGPMPAREDWRLVLFGKGYPPLEIGVET